jgi:integrase
MEAQKKILPYTASGEGDTVNNPLATALAIAAPPISLSVADGLTTHLGAWHGWLAEQVENSDLSAATAATYRNGMARFLRWQRESGAPATSGKAFGDFKHAMRQIASPASVNVWLAGVKSFFAWAFETGHLASNPVAGVRGFRRKGANKTHKRDMLTDAEAARLLALPLPARDHAILALKLYTGVRDVEVHRANFSDLRTHGGRKVLRIQGKGTTEIGDFVVINAKCDDALAAWLAVRGNDEGALFTSGSDRNKGGRLSLSAIRTLVKAAYRQAGITEPTKTSHSTRHTAITKAARASGKAGARRMARHASDQTTEIYMHEVERLDHPAEDLIDYNAAH